MALVAAGLNHRTAPIEVREKLSLARSECGPFLRQVRAHPDVTEAAVLSTCNRTEVYLVDSGDTAVPYVREIFSQRIGEDAAAYLYSRRDRDAAAHLFRVTAGLDSMILGEAQIQGQVRDAWNNSREASGAAINRLFQHAQSAGARVREETGIGRGAASVSSAAVQLPKKIFGSLAGREAMVLGAGEIAALAVACLASEGVRVSIVANRTYERAAALAREHGAIAMHYDECWGHLQNVDVLVSSTASPHTIVGVEHVTAGLRARGDRPFCILDLALPRDVDPSVGRLENVFLYDLDDLRAAAAANLDRRNVDIPAAERIVTAEAEKYWQWLAGLTAVPVVTEFRSRMDEIREQELAVALRRIGGLTPEQRDGLEKFSRSMMNKFLHEPSVRLRAAAINGGGSGVEDAARYLFALEKQESPDHIEQRDRS